VARVPGETGQKSEGWSIPSSISGSAVSSTNSRPAALSCASAGRVIAGAARIPRTLSPVKRRTLVT
jgi:hypothetical protein